MKNFFNGALRHSRKSFALRQLLNDPVTNLFIIWIHIIVICVFFLSSVLFSGCQKQNINGDNESPHTNLTKNPEANAVTLYNNISDQTFWELQQVRAATAKYRNIENAKKDGYADIEVDVEHMGHHFMKTAIVDSVFDIRQPEILVYNKDEKGNQQLVAVEYAIPLTYSRPEGFAGNNDVWKDDSGFPFWLLHAWIWAYNPDGVFNWTNELVHLH